MDSHDLYARLGVAPDAPVEVIRAAYKALLKQHHPDHAVDEADRMVRERRSQLLGEAHTVLTDPTTRTEYDRRRAEEMTGSGGGTAGSDDGGDSRRTRADQHPGQHTNRHPGERPHQPNRGRAGQESGQQYGDDTGTGGPVVEMGWTSPAGEQVDSYDALTWGSRWRLRVLSFADRDWRRFRRSLLRHRRRIGGLPVAWFGGPVDEPATPASWRVVGGINVSLTVTVAGATWLWSTPVFANVGRRLGGELWLVPNVVLAPWVALSLIGVGAVVSTIWLRRYGGWFSASRGARVRGLLWWGSWCLATIFAPLLVMPALVAAVLGGIGLWLSQRSA